MLLSFAPYLTSLGFYSDDWAFLGELAASTDQSLSGLFRRLFADDLAFRPIHVLNLALLYRLFGLEPLGYHLANGLVLITLTVLLYLVLREVALPRVIALATTLVYALLPHYSTVRFWYASFQVPLSVCLYLVSLYAALRAARGMRDAANVWLLVSGLSMLLSGLAYEVALPLFLLTPLLVWWRSRHAKAHAAGGVLAAHTPVTSLAMCAAITAVLVLYKAQTSTRLGEGSLEDRLLWLFLLAVDSSLRPQDGSFNIYLAASVAWRDYLFRLNEIMPAVIFQYNTPETRVLAAFAGLFIAIYLAKLYPITRTVIGYRYALIVMTVGLLMFWLGYAIFMTNYNVAFSHTGIANRTSIVAAAGVALSVVGAISLLAALSPWKHLGRTIFCVLAALSCSAGLLVIISIAFFWTAAYQQERAILADIYRYMPAPSPGETVILDGICPYLGPAIVFESSWDLQGALRIGYQDYTLRADVATPRMLLREDGLSTHSYGLDENRYPYSSLQVYDYRTKSTYRLADRDQAQAYFAQHNPDRGAGCPLGYEGLGVAILFPLAPAEDASDPGAVWADWSERGIRLCTNETCRAEVHVDALVPLTDGIEMRGWAALPTAGAQPSEVLVMLGDRPVATASLGGPRPDVARGLGRPDLRHAGFRAQLTAPQVVREIAYGISCPTAVRVIDEGGRFWSDFAIDGSLCH